MAHSGGGTIRSTGRIEAFSDGVFAIAITLLVLEFRIPAADTNAEDLSRSILALWPSYFAYALSFTMIGIYWANHHYLFKLIARTDHGLNLINLLLLASIAFLPFPTHILGTHWAEEASRPVAVRFYAIGLTFPAVAWLGIWLYVCHVRRLVRSALDPSFLHKLTLQYVASVVLDLLAVAATFINYAWGLAMCVVLTLLYLLPPRAPCRRPGGAPPARAREAR